MRVAPASSEFSRSSLRTEAGRSTTSPAAILLATCSERRWIRPMGYKLTTKEREEHLKSRPKGGIAVIARHRRHRRHRRDRKNRKGDLASWCFLRLESHGHAATWLDNAQADDGDDARCRRFPLLRSQRRRGILRQLFP